MLGVSTGRRARIVLCSAAGGAGLLLAASTAWAGNIGYKYDELGRVVEVTYANGEVLTYQYDPAGNRTLLSSNAANQPPTAVADSLVVQQNTAKTFDPTTNDTDPEDDPLTITAKTNGAKGTVALVGATSVTYTPNSGAAGTDSFTYTITDGTGPSTATVSVTINRPPTAVADSISTPSNLAHTFDPRTNDTDPDGNALTISSKTNGAHGTVAIVSGAQLTYTPTAGYTGADSFTYVISDGKGATATGTVTVTVTAAANQPPSAVNDAITTNQGVAKTFDPRTNDSDPEGSALTITVKTNGTKGTVAINSGATLTYTPTAGTFGADSFTYTIADPQGATDQGTVAVTINRLPAAVADTITTTKNTAKIFDPRANDSDADGNALTITAKTNGTNGTVAIGSGGTSLTYTPTTNYTGSDSFTYTVSDGQGGSATATVSATVTGTVANGTVLYTSSTAGAFSYTVPAGVAFVDIEGWGGGANGAFFPSPINMYFGGGGGGYFKKHIAVTQGQVIAGNVAAGGGTAATTVTSPALTATTPLPLNGQSGGQGGVGGTATGGDINTSGNACCQVAVTDGGGAGNGGGNQTTLNANGTAPGGGGAGNTGLGANGRITITARTS